MSRSKVPHCRECECFRVVRPVVRNLSRNLGYKCLFFGETKWIKYQETKTCPKWCPKR